jgi:hypothetical protein
VLHIEYTLGASGPVNQAPTANAGSDQSVTLPASATLVGSASDDGLPALPGTLTTWSMVSGPGTVTFADASAPSTSASFSTAGTYVLRLTASDSELSSFDDVQVIVSPAPPVNQPPVVDAGSDQSVTLPASASLVGTASDDGLPAPPGTLTARWAKVSGPGKVTFGNQSALSTSASFGMAGVYVLRLTVSDSLLSRADEIQITVSPKPPANKAPTVSAGANKTVTFPASVTLVGTASDDGLPNPPGTLTVSWTKVSGPGTVTFGNASALTTSVSFSAAGTYVLRLTVSDSVLSKADDVQITVKAPKR